MKQLRLSLFVALALAPACGELDSSSDPDGGGAVDDPRGQTVRVTTRYGERTMRYVERDGRAIAEGDIDLGPIEKMRQRANITIDLSKRWPDGVVPYVIDPAIPMGDLRRSRLATAIAHYHEMTPLEFVEEPVDLCPAEAPNCTDYIWVTSTNLPGVGGTSALGFQGGKQNLTLAANASVGTAIHELGHALGMYHEQNRPDRNSYVDVHVECMDTGDEADDDANEIDWTGQYDQNGAGSDFGAYDFASIMHYSSTGGRDEDWQLAPCNGKFPMERKPAAACPSSICFDPGGDGFAEEIRAQRSWLSASDVNALWGMYGRGIGASEDGDRFGAAVAAADFDDDGLLDLAVGAPGEDVDGIVDAGAVFLYKGTGEGLQPWRTFTQGSLGGASETGDAFGSALAAGDLDDDGYPDLAIGTPGEVANGFSDTGAVFVARGTRHGLDDGQIITPGSVGEVAEANDRLGNALAIGDFDGDGVQDLAIGSDGEQPGANPDAGRVFVMRGIADGNLVAWDQLGQEEPDVIFGGGGIAPPPLPLGSPSNGDRFGYSLAAGRLDGDARDDLVVGAMCDHDETSCGGAVYVFRGAAASMQGWQRLKRPAPAFFERIGWSVAIIDRDADGDGDIASGAPLATAGGQSQAGLVHLWNVSGNSIVDGGSFTQSGFAANEPGDQLGAALVAVKGSIFTPTQLLVGVPREGTNGDLVETGVVQRFRVTAGALAHDTIMRETPAGLEEDGDEFGVGLAAVAWGLGTQIFVGTPGENSDQGAVFVFGALGAGAPVHQQVLVQHGVGTHAP